MQRTSARWTGSAAVAVALVLVACSSAGDDPGTAPTPAVSTDPPTGETTGLPTGEPSGPESVVTPEGFDAVAAVVTRADGTTCDVCLWLAATADQRSRGLMSVTDLGGADGMAFRYDRPTTSRFWMRDTLLPLSIAFFDAGGVYLDAFDMEPCTTADCLRYPTAPDFLVAVETVAGGLPALGMATGSTLALSDLPCDPAA